MKWYACLLAAMISGSPAAMAQQDVAIDTATANRLGLVFATVAPPESGDGARFSATVITSPQTATGLRALNSGVVVRWEVQAGQSVEAGDVLVVLRSEDMLRLQQDWIAAIAADAQATAALTRDQALFSEGVIAAQRLQQTERDASEARFNLQALTSALEQRGYPRDARDALRKSDADPGLYLVRAPSAGTVTQVLHVTGDMIDAGETVVTLSGGSLWVEAAVPARVAAQVALSQTLELEDHTATLTVRQKNQALDARTQTQTLRAEFNDAVTLLPGQVVTVRLPPHAGGIVVPADAVVRNGTDTVVYVRSAGGVESRALQLQPIGADYLAMDGLVAGEEVVVRGASLIKGITLGLGGE